MRNPSIDRSLLKTLSRHRLGRYLAEAGDDLDLALGLYERNTRLAESLYTPLQCLEICLRNVIDERMTIEYGPNWLDLGSALLDHPALRAAAEIKGRHADVRHETLVAELKFSFWVGLLGPSYDASLWRETLHRGFRANGPRRRREVHQRLNAIRRFRNRVAHHEPVADKAGRMHGEIIEAIGWMCRDTMAWTEHLSRFRLVLEGP